MNRTSGSLASFSIFCQKLPKSPSPPSAKRNLFFASYRRNCVQFFTVDHFGCVPRSGIRILGTTKYPLTPHLLHILLEEMQKFQISIRCTTDSDGLIDLSSVAPSPSDFLLQSVEAGRQIQFALSTVSAGSGKPSEHVAMGSIAFSCFSGGSIGAFRSIEWIGEASCPAHWRRYFRHEAPGLQRKKKNNVHR